MKRTFKRARFGICLLAAMLFVLSFGSAAYAQTLNVTKHTKEEISNYIKNSGVTISDEAAYSVEPVRNTQRGELTTASKESALQMLNNIRYIAGLNPVALNQTQGDKAQAAAFVMWSTDQFTHYIEGEKPDSMSQQDWDYGVEGAKSSNIAWGYSNLNASILNGWIGDDDSSNVARVGHRRWCLNPKMGTTGFGKAGAYNVMWSFDQSVSSEAKRVAWPAQYMPVDYFGNNIPWSLSTGDASILDVSNVSVTLTRRDSSPSGAGSWTFSTANTYTAAGSGEYFNVAKNNPYEGYSGQGGPYVVFRPANVSYKAGDIFDVKITGLGSEEISYSVEFFDRNATGSDPDPDPDPNPDPNPDPGPDPNPKPDPKPNPTPGHDHSWTEWTITTPATILAEGEKTSKCSICGSVRSEKIARLNPFAKFAKKKYKIKKGKSLKLKGKLSYANGDKIKKWKSSNKSVATVNKKGKVVGRKSGKAKITVIMQSGKKATCVVRVVGKR
ncbi:MAG: Ig-like domain-containing protein [Mogibacterium sp.]|nr:Ig-like domain-containing protein [Mogibacterium sp.]